MSGLFWPGDERAGALFSAKAYVQALVATESAWLAALVVEGLAPAAAADDLTGLVHDEDLAALGGEAEGAGNPVPPLLRLLRGRLTERNPAAAAWLHRGLTSQDVVDTAMLLCARDVLTAVSADLASQVADLVDLADRHRGTLVVARTLTQHALPTTFGVKVAGWLGGLLDAAEPLGHVAGALPVQVGGAAGTHAAVVELARTLGREDAVAVATRLPEHVADTLGLRPSAPWHTSRAVVARLGDALVGCTDAWGRIASDVLVASRTEVAELSEPVAPGRGGSSTLPQKQNPVLSVLLRRAALAGPASAQSLHLASALSVDERSDGAWHLEWETLQLLARRTAVAASQATELLSGLQVHTDVMADRVRGADGILAERDAARRWGGGGDLDTHDVDTHDVESYLGAAAAVTDVAVNRARAYLQENV